MALQADVIVVGSGPAGISAAWPLVRAGVNVLMLDAAGDQSMPQSPEASSMAAWRNEPERWRHEFGWRGPIGDSGRSPKFATPLARAALAGFDAAAGLRTQGFFGVGSLAAGGLSRIWGALAVPSPASELAAWGSEADAMRQSFARVQARIGISGPARFAPPVEQIWRRHRDAGANGDFTLVPARNAVLDHDRGSRRACNACGLCLLGCGRGSIYHGALELGDLAAHANFAYRSGMFVHAIGGEAGAQHVDVRHDGQSVRLLAKVVVLAAGTLMTTRLVLRRLGLTGQAVRIESNPVGATAFVIPRLIGSALPAHAFGLGQLFYTQSLAPDMQTAGVLYGADTLPLATIADRLPLTRPAALRMARALMPALVLATGYLPGRASANRLTVEDDGADGRIVIEGHQTHEADALLRDTFARLARRMRKAGAWPVPGATQILDPGADAHPAATLPMGGTGPAATDPMGGVNRLPGVYAVDGSALPRLSAWHPTLTIMANADRIGTALARRFVPSGKGVALAG